MSPGLPMGAMVLVCSSALLAAERPVIEEIVVTAQRVEENLQKVPIAASAFNDTLIQDRQIVGLADLQLNVPNLSFRDDPFARGRYIIRGVGRQAGGGTVEDGVAVYVDGVPIPGEANFDFVDMERLEVMRGPQGTLFGRNATGGAINMVTSKPNTDALEGHLEIEYGDYEHRRARGAVNLPISDRLAIRVAGMGHKRDGFTENLAGGQVDGIDDDMDGRDLWSSRTTAKWWINDSWSFTVMHNHFEEDDDRLRTHALVCKQSPLPAAVCVPGGRGFDPPHPYAEFAGVNGRIAELLGVLDPGARDASTGLLFDFPRPEVDFRHQHVDFDPIYTRNEDVITGSLEWVGERFSLTLSGGHYDQKLLFQHDERFDVGWSFQDTPAVPSGLWPTSSQPFGIGGLLTSSQCNINDGTAGVPGGCIWPADQTRNFTYNSQQLDYEQTSVEARLHSRLQGPVNFVLGGNYLTSDRSFEFSRFFNVNDQLTLGTPLSGLPFPLTPGFLNVYQKNYDFETHSAFGELYWQATDTLKLTAGLRYNNDAKSIDSARQNTFQNVDVTGGTDQPEYIRLQLLNWFFGAQPESGQLALADLYGATAAINAAPFGSVERLRAFQLVPQAAGFNELRDLAGVPTKKTWEGISARLGVSWTPRPDQLVYAFYLRGYKPGNFEVEGRKGSDEETVDTIELGAKMRLDDGRMRANLALFWNDYTGLQLTAFNPERDQLIRELDAESWGAELELDWHPAFLAGAQLHLAYSWLHSEVGSALAVDSSDLAQGNPEYVVLRDSFGTEAFVARRDQVLPLVDQAVALGFANPALNTVYPDGIPSLFSLGFLNAFGVETSTAGLPFDLKGSEIPSAPEHTLNIGLSYSWHLNVGAVHARYDYYWQSKSFGRVHNSPGDRIDPWHQHNVSLAYEPASERWSIKVWARNLTDEDNVNHQEPSAAGGRPTSINDPRLFGATLRVNFGI